MVDRIGLTIVPCENMRGILVPESTRCLMHAPLGNGSRQQIRPQFPHGRNLLHHGCACGILSTNQAKRRSRLATLSILQRLEAEAIHVMREAVAESSNPVVLYSIGKDSSVLLRLAQKAFFPARLPFPLLHVDTTWKFREMYAFRDQTVRELRLDLRVHVNREGLDRGITPSCRDRPSIPT